MSYFTLLTNTGITKLSAATANGTPLKLTKIVVGDGNGSDVSPSADMTALVNQVHECNINELTMDENNNSHVIATAVIPADHGNFWIREIGLVDEQGDLIAIGNQAATHKPILEDGLVKEMILRMVIEVSNSSAITVQMDPSIIMASKEYVHNHMPTGSVITFASANAPAGFLECDGSEISRTGHARLFAVIGTTYGEGDSTTTFNLPDLRGEFIRGFDHGRGVDENREFGQWQEDTFQGHYPDIITYGRTHDSSTYNAAFGQGYINGGGTSQSMNDSRAIQDAAYVTDRVNGIPRAGKETKPRNIAMMYCIKD